MTDHDHQRLRVTVLSSLAALLLLASAALWPQQLPPQTPGASQSLLSQADAVLKEMSRITGLPIKAPLKKRVVGRDGMRPIILAKLHSENTPEEIREQELTLKVFGLVPPDFDLSRFLGDFYTEQAAGFYDPKSKTMYIASWVPAEQQKMVLAHELTHALQDQNFGLEQYIRAVKDDDDATAARLAVVEGYATAAMIQEMIGAIPLARMPSMQPFLAMAIHQDPGQFPVFAKAPFFFRFQSLFPYSQGLGFIQQDLARSDWEGLRRLFSRPPQTTQQIFDPPLYFKRAPVTRLDLPNPPAPSRRIRFREVYQNTLGELGYYGLLGQLISEDEARAVVPAWAADAYAVYDAPQTHQLALIARTVWTSEAKAAQFFRDYESILRTKYRGALAVKLSTTKTFIASVPAGEAVIVLRSRQCIFGEGISKGQEADFEKWAASLKDLVITPGNQIASAIRMGSRSGEYSAGAAAAYSATDGQFFPSPLAARGEVPSATMEKAGTRTNDPQ